MASTILYKFRSGTSFEPLPLPGTSARLFDIKKAIVNAKKLNSSSSNTSLEFDLSIQNATTNEVYDDESMILPRGTRIVVRRVAAERGKGILSRMAVGGLGAQVGGRGGASSSNAVNDGFYTIRSRDRETDDEFLDAVPPPPPQATTTAEVDESAELEALKAVTDQAGGFGHYGGPSVSVSGADPSTKRARDPRIAGQGAPPQFAKPPPFNNNSNNNNRYRPNADPELRQQELMSMPQPKKRATGIPRTFLNLNAPTSSTTGPDDGGGGEGGDNNGGETSGEGTGGGGEGSDLATQLQPSAQAFQALVRSGGGQSLSSSSKRRDLDYALKLTATSIPDHLQCGICSGIVKNAMLVPWDTEGRPTCESCIRDGLTKNGFTCPLTGIEGVSPDDLFPNVGLRKAADMFVKDVMDKLDSIERQIEAEEEEEEKKRIEREKAAMDAKGNDEFEDGGDGILTKRTKLNGGSKKSNNNSDDLLFGGDDEFGGDVFDVVGDEEEEPEDTDEGIGDNTIIDPADNTKTLAKKDGTDDSATKTDTTDGDGETAVSTKNNDDNNDQQNNTGNSNFLSQKSDGTDAAADDQQSKNDEDDIGSTSSPSKTSAPSSRSSSAQKETKRVRRAPPAGYVLGPAGSGAMTGPSPTNIPPPPPPPRNVHVDNNMGRGAGPGHMMGRGNNNMNPGPGRGFYPPNQQFGGRGNMNNGGRFNHQQQPQSFPSRGGHPNNMSQGYPGGPGRGGGGRGGFQQGGQFGGRGPQWGDNNNGNDWNNRKRPHDSMMMGQQQQQGSPMMNNMYQGGDPNQQQGGWHGGGRGGYQQYGGRGPPGRGFGGRGGPGRGFYGGRGRGRF